ncbi:MAG: flagellar biosynthetic protein FliR [Planctomycetota bacterium]
MGSFIAIFDQIPVFMLVFARVSGLFIFAPMLAALSIPIRVRVALALMLTLALTPVVALQGIEIDLATMSIWALLPLFLLNVTIGAAIGFMANMPMVAVQTGGLMMAQQMGLGFARFFNPAVDDEADVLGQLLYFMALAGFLALGGHEWMFIAIAHSFEHVPVTADVISGSLITLLGGMLNAAMELAIRISAPVVALTFLESVALGFVSKSVPQLNILSLGFPLRILLGFGMLMFSLIVINEVLLEEVDFNLRQIFLWIEGGAR